jgi:hypothetical protein
MNTQKLAVEALIDELASGILMEASHFQPTVEQISLRIPSHLIYLTGLVSATTTTSWNESRFEEYQKLYYEKLRKAPPIVFQSSPRNRATPEQQILIDQDVTRKQVELEVKAQQAANELLVLETLETKERIQMQTKETTENKKSNPALTAQKHSNTETSLIPNDQEKAELSTLEQLVMEIQSETCLSTIESDSDPSSWITVPKKGSLGKAKSAIHENEVALSLPSHHNVESTMDSESKISSFAADETDEITARQISTLHVQTNDKPSTVCGNTTTANEEPNNTTHNNDKNADSIKTMSLENRVRQLELQLKKKDLELQQERQVHAKAMSQKHLDFDNQIQALQLRLYISETRVKTFQDALEQHVEAVSNNHAMMQYSSPTRTKSLAGRQEQRQKEEQPLTPLISRVLNRQSKLSNNTEKRNL